MQVTKHDHDYMAVLSRRFTGIYGEPQADQKHRTWELMRDLHSQDPTHMPWLSAGDFNEILFHHEKEGGVQRAQVCLDRFREALEFCEIHDL